MTGADWVIEPPTLQQELRALLNRHSFSIKNGVDTPDFILAGYLLACLDAFTTAVKARDTWHGDEDTTEETP